MKRLSLILAALAALVVAALGDWTIGVVGNVVQVEGNAIQAGGAAWTPADLPGLVLWLDASDYSTLALSNNYVAAWADKSGAGNHTTQATLAYRRVYKASDAVANGLPSVSSDDTYIRWVTTPSLTIAQVWVVAAYKDRLDSTFDSYAILMCGDKDTGRIGMGLNRQATWYASGVLASTASKNGGTPSSTALPLPLTCLRFDLSSATTYAWQIGGYDNPVGSDRGWQGPICEVVCVDVVQTPAAVAQVEAYLMAKWGIE